MQTLLIIAIALFCIFMLPFNIALSYDEDFYATAQVLFFKFQLLPKKKGKTKMNCKDFGQELKKSKKQKRAEKKAAKKSEKKKTQKKKYSADDIPFYLELIQKFVSRAYNSIRRGLTIKIKKLGIAVATSDAAKTAVTYGVISQSVAYLLQFFDSIARVKCPKKSEIYVTADFLSSETIFDFNIVLSWRLWRLLCIAVSLLYRTLVALMAHLNHSKIKNTINIKKTTTEEK